MADLERAKQALINAHNAGDKEAATKLATYIKSQQAQPVETQAAEHPQVQEAPQGRPGDFTGNMAYDLQKRAAAAEQIKARRASGEISKPEEIFQLAGKVGAGTVADISGNILGSSLKTADKLTGGIGSAGISRLGRVIGSLPSVGGGNLAGQIPRDLGNIGASYQQFAAENPRAATNIEAAANLATVMPGLVKGAEAVGSAVQKTGAAMKRPPIPKAEEIREQAGNLYKLAEQQGGTFKPGFLDDFISKVSQKTPQTSVGKAMEGESPVAAMLDRLQPLRGQPLTFEGAKEADEILGQLAYATADRVTGKLDATGQKFLEMQSTLRKMIDDAPDTALIGGKQGFETVKQARKFWAAQQRMADIERIIDNAEFFQQPSTAIKTGFRQILRDKGRLLGYSGQEVNAMKKAARTGALEGLFKLGGSGLGPIGVGAGGALMGAATGGIGGGVGGALAAVPAYLAQQGMKNVAEGIATGKAANVARTIAQRVVPQTAGPSIGANLANVAYQTGRATAPAAVADLAGQGMENLTMDQLFMLSPEEFNRLTKRPAR